MDGVGELPVTAPHERGDAARNRLRLLDAARTLIAERGTDAVSMDDIAAAAGVGKGTVFRRFGSRAGLMMVLLDEDERALQHASCSDHRRWARTPLPCTACWPSAGSGCGSSTPIASCSRRPTAIPTPATTRPSR